MRWRGRQCLAARASASAIRPGADTRSRSDATKNCHDCAPFQVAAYEKDRFVGSTKERISLSLDSHELELVNDPTEDDGVL